MVVVGVDEPPTAQRWCWVPAMPSSSLEGWRLGLGVRVQACPFHRSIRVRLTRLRGE